jgi:predicted nucleic acid-binding protein
MPACVIDADVVIAALDDHDSSHRAATRAMTGLFDQGTALLLSLVNYTETLVHPARDPAAFSTATTAIGTLGLELVAPTASIAREAAQLRSRGVSLPDAFALATARARGAGIATLDRRVRKAAQEAGVGLAPGLR